MSSYTPMKKLLSRSLGALALLVFASACRSSSLPELETKLERQGASDTLALVTYIGQPQYTDSLLHFDAGLSLSPDTSRYHAVLISHAGGQRLRYYELRGGRWQEQEPPLAAVQLSPTAALPFSGRDIEGRERSLSELYARHPLVLVFASPEGGVILTATEQRRLRAAARPDSLGFVFLLPTPSAREARQQLRRDSLEGIAFCDSLGLVTELRRSYGVTGSASTRLFHIDTLGKVK